MAKVAPVLAFLVVTGTASLVRRAASILPHEAASSSFHRGRGGEAAAAVPAPSSSRSPPAPCLRTSLSTPSTSTLRYLQCTSMGRWAMLRSPTRTTGLPLSSLHLLMASPRARRNRILPGRALPPEGA